MVPALQEYHFTSMCSPHVSLTTIPLCSLLISCPLPRHNHADPTEARPDPIQANRVSELLFPGEPAPIDPLPQNKNRRPQEKTRLWSPPEPGPVVGGGLQHVGQYGLQHVGQYGGQYGGEYGEYLHRQQAERQQGPDGDYFKAQTAGAIPPPALHSFNTQTRG